MKLLKNDKKLNLFSDEYDIQLDKNLKKYVNLLSKDETVNIISPEEELKVAVSRDEFDPDNFEVYIRDKNSKEKLIKQVENMSTFREIVKGENAKKFNLKISKRLHDLLKNNSGRHLNFIHRQEPISMEIRSINNDLNDKKKKKEGFFSRFFKRKKAGKKVDKEPEKVYELSVIDLFENVKVISGKEREFKDRLDEYLSLIHKSLSMNQMAQYELLVSKLIVHVYESVLAVSGFNRYVTFSDLIELQGKCERQLDLDYIKNFTKVIPDEVVCKKIIADNLEVFDNYVVLYYDPSGNSFKLTREEEKIKKDPILFGMIYGSDKLYYISDWIDDYCDLTLEQVVEKLGKERIL